MLFVFHSDEQSREAAFAKHCADLPSGETPDQCACQALGTCEKSSRAPVSKQARLSMCATGLPVLICTQDT